MYIGVALSVGLLTQSAVGVFATEPTSVPTPRPAVMERRLERRQSIIERIALRVEDRFRLHEARLQNWIDRAFKHIADRQAKGKDETSAVTALNTAKASLVSATKLGDDAVAQLKAVSATDWATQKADAKAARESVKAAQVAFAQVVKNLNLVLKELRTEK